MVIVRVFDLVGAGVNLEELIGVVGVARLHADCAAVRGGRLSIAVEADAIPRFDLVGGPVVRPLLVFAVDVAFRHANLPAGGYAR